MVEVNNHVIEGLTDIGVSMLVIAASVVRELGIVHLVSRLESYKTLQKLWQTIGGISDFPIHVEELTCKIDFMDNDACCLD